VPHNTHHFHSLKRNRLLGAWGHFVCRCPRLVLLLALILTAGAVLYTIRNLEFKSDRSDLIDPSLPWQIRYTDFKTKFPRWNDAVVVVDLTSAPRATTEAYIAQLESSLRADARFSSVIAGFPRSDAPAGLVLTQPTQRVRQIVDDLNRTGPVLASPSLDRLLALSALGGSSIGEADRKELRALLERAATVANNNSGSVLGLADMNASERLVTPSGSLATIMVGLSAAPDPGDDTIENGVNTPALAIAALRDHMRQLRLDPRFSMVQAGVTGVPVLESDETSQSLRDASRASVIALSCITLLMLIVYRGMIVPVFAVLSLLIGMAWSFAWATFAVGHLQVLSVTFASLLLGLGIDVAIHIIARLELVHPDHDHMGPAVAQAFRGVGPGIITASVTVAAAAAAMALTTFAGVGELGIIAAGGMILCTIAILCCLPAMLELLPRPERSLRSRHGGESRPFMGRLGAAMDRHSRAILVASAAVVLVAAWFAAGVRYDSDLEKLMPTGVESVVWENRLEADDERSVWHAVVIADSPEHAADLTTRLRQSPEVADVAGIGMLFPAPAELDARLALLRTLPDPAHLPGDAPAASTVPGAAPAALRTVASSLARTWNPRDAELSSAAGTLAQLPDDTLTRIDDAYRADRAALLHQIAALRSAQPARPSDLPDALRNLMVGADGSLLLRVYPAAAPSGISVLSPERLNAFATAVLAIAPTATGPTVQIFESTRLINSAYLRAGLYALIAIIALLTIDFGLTRQGLLDTACVLLPVAIGSILMLALMRLFGVELNFANMIVMPLIVGIGVGMGVHAVRRWRLQPRDIPLGLAGGSGRAIGLTTLTTAIGFAAMMTAEHRGVRSLGFVMTVGLAMVWAAAIFVLPAVLRLRADLAQRAAVQRAATLRHPESEAA